MKRRLDLCADDFGQSPGISQGIALLARAGRLSSLSCLCTSDHWPASAALLAALDVQRIGIGLHFNLTEGRPLSRELAARWPALPGIGQLIVAAHTGRLPLMAIASEWRAQLAAFVAGTGRLPAHVDGHQHVHHLPGVRDILLDGIAALDVPPAVRNTGWLPGPGPWWKRRVIERSGGLALQRALQARGLRHAPALLGAYDFRQPDYRRLMQAWLHELPAAGAVLFCHPGQADEGAADAIAPARAREFAYFAGDDWPHDLAAAQVELKPLSETSMSG